MKLRSLLLICWALCHTQAFSQSEQKLLKQIRTIAATLLPESPWVKYPNNDFKYEFDNEMIFITNNDRMETVLSKIYWKDIVGVVLGDSTSSPDLCNFITVDGKAWVKYENSDWKPEVFNANYLTSLRMGLIYDRRSADKLVELLKKMALKKGAMFK